MKGQDLPVMINQQTRFSRTKEAVSVADSQYTLIRSEEIHKGDSIHVTASSVDNNLVASEVQKRTK